VTQCNTAASTLLLDDSTGCILVNYSKIIRPENLAIGRYFMILGILRMSPSDKSAILWAQQINDLTNETNRESIWILEVIDIHQRIYSAEK